MEIVLDKETVDPKSSLGQQLAKEFPVVDTEAEAKAAADKAAADKSAADKAALDKAEADRIAAEKAGEGQSVVKPEEIESSVIESVFGKKLTKDEAKKLVEQLPNIFKEVEELKANQPKFANDYIKGLNDYLEKGGDAETYNRIQALDLEKLQGLDVIKAKYKWENPQLTEDQIDKKLKRVYHQGEDDLAEDKENGLIDIAIDAKKAKEELLKIKQEKSIPDPERLRQQEEQDEATRISSWKSSVSKIVKEFNSFDVPLAYDKDGKPTDVFKFTDFPDDLRKAVEQEVNLIIEESGIPHTQEAIQAVSQEVVRDRFLSRAFPKIIQAVFTEAETRAKKAKNAEYHNDNPPPKGDATEGAKKATNEDEVFEMQMKRL